MLTIGWENMFGALYANENGEVCEHPEFGMLARSGNEWIQPVMGDMIPLPKGSTLVSLPGHIAVGCTLDNKPFGIQEDPFNKGKIARPVAALLPQGFTRTLLPAAVAAPEATELPLFGYAAVGFKGARTFVAAVQSDEFRQWHPCYFNTRGLADRVNRTIKKYPHNRIYRQLALCALEYGCFTAQNIFYQRWEGGIPTMNRCNARCLGCISQSHSQATAPQRRLDFLPEAEEISQVGSEHLEKAARAIVSFGQGCEGDPLINASVLARAISDMRLRTDRGTINMNSNAGYTRGIKILCRAGLQALRVTLFSCREKDYQRYHRPQDYSLKDVVNSVCYAKEKGVYVSINLLTFPGYTDRESQIDSLMQFIRNTGVDMVQLRNLNIDPDVLMREFPGLETGIGITDFLCHVQSAVPWLKLGSYTHTHPGAK